MLSSAAGFKLVRENIFCPLPVSAAGEQLPVLSDFSPFKAKADVWVKLVRGPHHFGDFHKISF
ncbi:hypothetical protein [Pseudomonas sp. GOM6]|uniref:hypothetical protein n=1 Tax=Pseudomonas sp. GOM6 TaxID=3036944 RepID=UPI002409D5A6|nr:hypothetical protein [Pseudomonas sp. GOM6]MDG1581595.1 hypothetical protein [Pseudomonas sp. GOM6]